MSKNQPFMKKRVGRFQISVWKCERVVPSPPDRDYIPERVYDVFRACVQYSRYDKKLGDFDRQQIWCNQEELRALALALEELGSDDDEVDSSEA